MAQRSGTASRISHRLLDATHKLFHDCHRIRDGDMTERGFHRQISIQRAEVESALAVGCYCADAATTDTCWDHFKNLWVFQYQHELERTNNSAERSLRHVVTWQYLSFGPQSDSGSRFVDTLLTAIETCRQHCRDVFRYLRESHQRILDNQPPTWLLTGPSTITFGVCYTHLQKWVNGEQEWCVNSLEFL